MPAIIETKNISVHYGQTMALKDISFAIEKGDFVGLIGPNGAGKTTLIKALLGLLPLSGGNIELFGKMREKFNDWSRIGYLPQQFSAVNALFPATAEEVVTLGLLSKKSRPKRISGKDRRRTGEILQELGISSLRTRMLSELSGGQQQKVFLARALASEPEVLILDEPTTALDAKSREEFMKLIQNLNISNGITIILITHDTNLVCQYANKLMYIDRKLVFFGSVNDFFHSNTLDDHLGDYGKHVIFHHQHD